MADRRARLQILPVDVELLREAPPPEEVARELVARLSALPYVVDVQWSPEVVTEEDELGKDRFLHGRVTMLPLEQLPEDDPELVAYYECFKMPGVVGPSGAVPLTAKRQAEHAIEEFDRIDQEKRIRAALDEDERRQVAFFEANREWFTQQGFVQKPPLSPVEIELSVALNMLWEDLDEAAYGESKRGGLGASDFDQGHAAGVHWGATMVWNEISRRNLGFVARGAPWPF